MTEGFYCVMNWRLLFSGRNWIIVEERLGGFQVKENEQIFGWWWDSPHTPGRESPVGFNLLSRNVSSLFLKLRIINFCFQESKF